MMKPETAPARAPRGTKPVSQAFFAALESIPDASRAAVGKAALTMIRDEMKARKDKLKLAAAKEKAANANANAKAAPVKAKPKVKAVASKRIAKAAVEKPVEEVAPRMAPEPKMNGAAPAAKRRPRKVSETPTAA